jgi:hypothetical protein
MLAADMFEQATILRIGPDALARVIVRSSWSERESLQVRGSCACLSAHGAKVLSARLG